MRRAALAACVVVCALAQPALAEPTLWQHAKDPSGRARARARLRAEQLFEQSRDPHIDPEMHRELSLGGAALLQLSGGAKRDPWQALLLGRVLLEAQPGRERQAIQLIEANVGALPDSDFKSSSYFDLGFGAMIVGEYERAEKAFAAALALAWSPDDRASIHRNRGKARMLGGRLQGAVADFRAAVQLARGVEVMALSHYGLGVALERSGDYPQGLLEVAIGAAVQLPVPPYASPSVLDLPTLRWIPEYDVSYFRALGEMAAAGRADSPDAELEHWLTALESWEQYLPAAEAQHDRFFPNASRHRERCREAIQLLSPARPAPGKLRPSRRVR